jgi:putative endopeptidase
MTFWKHLAPALIAPLLLGACMTTPAPISPEPSPTPPVASMDKPKPKYGTYGFDTAGMDTSVKPGDDFFAYANGTWVKNTEIPADRSSINTFVVLTEEAGRRTRAIIEDAAKADAPLGSDARKIGDYYASFMDEAAIEAAGAEPLKPELAAIAAIRTRRDLSRALGETLRADVDALNATDFQTDRLFGLWVAEDMNDTTKYRPYLMQGGLWLPDRAYYLEASPKFTDLRAKYLTYIGNLLRLAGYYGVEARARRVLAHETAMATVHWAVYDSSNVT